MPGQFYDQEAMWVDDAALDFLLDAVDEEDEEIVVEECDPEGEEEIAVVMIDEGDLDKSDLPMVVEEDERSMPPSVLIPGSDAVFDDRVAEEPVKDTDWAKDGDPKHFIGYVKDKLTKIPRHSGETIPGCERAKSFLKSIDNEISKAMRVDLEGVIDEQEIDAIRKELENMVERLDKQIKKLKGSKKAAFDVKLFANGSCEKCGTSAPMWHNTSEDKMVCMHCESEVERHPDVLEKTAGTPVLNVYMSPFERAIVGTIINSKVSGGKNIEETYDKLKNKYNFTPREELAIQQLVADYGYPVYKDRGLLNEPSDPASGDGVEWQTNYNS